ncbi:hypothetical protein SAMN04488598_1559 [Halanaerobium congolense]|uniref:Uncharacterized protein n=1 Tax=Halanaerobium congolense TaxID=54121 RepID=A0A1I0CDN4_9FIRM|nr:hypothetical protein [Halanaerobium congolense]PTX14809.1 hypothetical protein C7953_2874 [Halanaerobium congolense]SDG17065.1 hypothetical protein SAMN04488598_1559 [Halanaerobium congolense]SET17691.1 hypothetical protein SAMN04515652_1354 [Halanaerobium congolense]SFP67658.1 hypothetical protein SAMN04488596_1394 [Halanaerobium congolense]
MADNKVKDKAGKIKGILDGLNNNDEESEGNKSSKEEKSKRIKEDKNKSSKEGKKKRSFMLKNSQIEKIYLLKAKNSDMTMSEIVGQAIDEFYESESEN